jgi:hypothetical protein
MSSSAISRRSISEHQSCRATSKGGEKPTMGRLILVDVVIGDDTRDGGIAALEPML